MKKNYSNILDIFLEIVQIDSPSGQEQKMISYLTTWLESLNFQYEIDNLGNILARNFQISKNKNKKSVMLCAHMDTVDPCKNIKPIIENQTIKSDKNTILGADNKVAIASIIFAIEKMKSQNILEKKKIEILFTVREETGGGVEFFDFKKINSEVCFIFDSANPLGGIVLRSPFISNFHLTFLGKACHSSDPSKGVNALDFMIKFLSKIKTGKLNSHNNQAQTTINVGKISGGTGINTVPDKVNISGEVRSYDEKLFYFHLKNIENLANQISENHKFKTDGFCAGYSHDKHDDIIQDFIENIFKNLNLKSKFYEFSGISDANPLNSFGIKTFNLTSGEKNPHTVHESMKISDLKTLGNIVFEILNNFNSSADFN